MLLRARTVIQASPLASTLPGLTSWPWASGKPAPASRWPPMKVASHCQSWSEEVPSSRTLLPGIASSRVLSAAVRAEARPRKVARVTATLIRVFILVLRIGGFGSRINWTPGISGQFEPIGLELDSVSGDDGLIGFDGHNGRLETVQETGGRTQARLHSGYLVVDRGLILGAKCRNSVFFGGPQFDGITQEPVERIIKRGVLELHGGRYLFVQRSLFGAAGLKGNAGFPVEIILARVDIPAEQGGIDFLKHPGLVFAQHHGGIAAIVHFVIGVEGVGQRAIISQLDTVGELKQGMNGIGHLAVFPKLIGPDGGNRNRAGIHEPTGLIDLVNGYLSQQAERDFLV